MAIEIETDALDFGSDDMLTSAAAERAEDIDPIDLINGSGEGSNSSDDGNDIDEIVTADSFSLDSLDSLDGNSNQEDGPVPDGDAILGDADTDADTETDINPLLADTSEAGNADTSDSSSLKLRADRLHEASLLEAKEELSQLAIRRSELEAELKEVKAEEKGALKHLQQLIARGPLYPKPQSKIQEAVANAEESAVEKISKYDQFENDLNAGNFGDGPGAAGEVATGQVIQENENWKIIPTSEIIAGIKGMGAKKAEAIIDLAPTLGDLVELQAQAGIEHLPFAKVLPKGVGQGMADEIEERILNACKVRFINQS